MVEIQVTLDDRGLEKLLVDLPERELPFAFAKALTRAAQASQHEVRVRLPRRFTIRTPWVAKGIRIKAANKRELVAHVWVKDEFMTLQETGGDKRPALANVLGVPVGARPTPKSVTRPGVFPGRLLARKRAFLGRFKSGARFVGLRSGKTWVGKRGNRRRGKWRVMYILTQRVHLRKRWDFEDTVRLVVNQGFDKYFIAEVRGLLAQAGAES